MFSIFWRTQKNKYIKLKEIYCITPSLCPPFVRQKNSVKDLELVFRLLY